MKPLLDYTGRRAGTVHSNGVEVRPCWGENVRTVQYYSPNHGGGEPAALKAYALDVTAGHYDHAIGTTVVSQHDDDGGCYLTVRFTDDADVPYQFGWTPRD
jgi:hypothetical protein